MGGKRKEWEAKHYHNKEKFVAYIMAFLLHKADINFDFFLPFYLYLFICTLWYKLILWKMEKQSRKNNNIYFDH